MHEELVEEDEMPGTVQIEMINYASLKPLSFDKDPLQFWSVSFLDGFLNYAFR